MHSHKAVMPKTVNLRPGNSYRKRPTPIDSTSSNNGHPKRRRTDASIVKCECQSALSFSAEFSDQLVPSEGGDMLISVTPGDDFQLNFFDDPCLPNVIDAMVEVEAKEEHPLGYFATLPTELFHLVLALLDNSDLGTLANVSVEMCIVVCGYVYSTAGLNNVIPQYSEGDFAEPMEFTHLG